MTHLRIVSGCGTPYLNSWLTWFFTLITWFKLYNKSKAIFKIIYDKGDYIFYNCRLETCEWELYRLYKKLGNIEDSNKHLQEAIKYAKAFDELKDYEEHTSILVEGNEYKKEKTSRGDTKSHLDIINELLSK